MNTRKWFAQLGQAAIMAVALSFNGVTRAANPDTAPSPPKPAPSPSLLQKALAGPMKEVEEILFCTRLLYDDPHWYANIGYYCDNEQMKAYAGNGRPDAGKLCKWNVKTGTMTVLLDARGGSVRDPQVHYEGRKILFSYRPAGTEFFHLYEMEADSTGLKQLTSGDFDDYEPTYLPDGGIAFVSTRCQRWVNCWKTQVGVIYRCDGDGANIQLISANTEHDNTPWPLPDGRLLYTRWEYVDRSQVEFHHLWTMNPDGTGATVYYGNMHPNIVMIDAKPIPGSDNVIASFSPGHGANEHAGITTILSAKKGPDDRSVARPLHRGKLIKDPYPLSEECILAARDNQIVLLDGGGPVEALYTHAGPGQVHEPRPILPRPRERILPRRSNLAAATGRMVVANVYDGRNLPGVKRGDIKKLLILESLPKQVNFSGGPDLVSWLGTFTLERVLGTVPVEEDGSAYFEAPARRQLFFVALDENDLSVKRMQSFTSVMPGEILSCAGCHEHRTKTPENRSQPAPLLALQRPPSKIQSFDGFPDVMDFNRDIQPILDRHCVRCHNYEKRDGQVILAGDLGPQWSHSFFSLFAHRQVADGRNGLGNQPPRTIGSSASALLKMVDGSHYETKATPQEWRTLWLWIESGAPYAGTYAALRNEKAQEIAGSATARVFREQGAVLQRRCFGCHNAVASSLGEEMRLPFDYEARRKNKGGLQRPTAVYERIVLEDDPIARFSVNIMLNFTRPQLSPLLLGPLAKAAGGFGSCGEVFKDTDDPDYRLLLSSIAKGKADLDAEPRFATPGFKPNPQYVREMKKYGILPPAFDLAKDTLNVYETDQEYWRSFWYLPKRKTAQR
ncbi:MAG: PD40 domain-containing protein [Chloroflexi bacterium]|nr:PD40 domain-containing protein [Chloroflexota bacterium]